MTHQRTHRWNVGLVATLALTTVGLLYANATILAATLIPLAYVLFGTVSSAPDESELAVEREISRTTAAPGTPAQVTLTLENTGRDVLPDVRLIDGVPAELAVEEGTPRLCTSLSPGESRTLEYSVVTQRGTYAFEDPVVRLRSLAGSEFVTETLAVTGDDELVCVSPLEADAQQRRTTPYSGVVSSDSGGTGLEFHSTRQYREGDPVSRIDWHHVAKTGEFITVNYREQKTSRTVLLVDARPVNRVTPRAGHPTAVDRCVYAGERVYASLTAAAVETTVGAVGLDEPPDGAVSTPIVDETGLAWADPNRESVTPPAVFDACLRVGSQQAGTQLDRVAPPHPDGETRNSQRRESSDESSERTPQTGDDRNREPRARARTDGGEETMALLERIPATAQVILFSPLLDDWPVTLCRRLAGTHDVLVVTPAPAKREKPGQRLTAVHRDRRLRELQRLQATTVDWAVGQPFELAFRETQISGSNHQ